MSSSTMRLALVITALPAALAQQSVWGQCGGNGYSGSTSCASGSACVYLNAYYSQCQPGSAKTTSTAPNRSTTVASTSVSSTTTKMVTSGPVSTPTTSKISTAPPTTTTISGATGTGPGTTLQSGYYWIRAVEAPNFHQYLATKPEYSTGTAILANYTAAGQFQIVDGQLVELISPSATSPTLLYASVGQPATPSSTLLPVSFTTSKNTFGTWSFSGDALEWNDASIKRPNAAAWYVCAGQQVFINTGQYLYGTPSGCVDETIHYYNGATAVD